MGIMIWLFVLLYYSMKAASRRLGGEKDASGSKQTLNRTGEISIRAQSLKPAFYKPWTGHGAEK